MRRHPAAHNATRSSIPAEALMLAALALAAAAGCDVPRDPEGSLSKATGNVLRVGVTEAPPWVVRGRPSRGQQPAAEGVEAEVVRRFAGSIGADIEWVWGPTGDHVRALERYDLHLAVGGYGAEDAWTKRVGTTNPYHTERWVVAAPVGARAPGSDDELRGRAVAVPRTGIIAARVREHGGVPLRSDDPWRADGLVAGPVWRLHSLGRDTSGIRLAEVRHVIAVPPGENGLLTALERSIDGVDIAALLARAAREGAR